MILLADWLPPVGAPYRNTALLIIWLAVCNIIVLALVILAKIIFYKWMYGKHLEEQMQGEKIAKLLVVAERLLSLAGERMERVAANAKEVKEGIKEMPEKTANKVVEKIQTSESGQIRIP